MPWHTLSSNCCTIRQINDQRQTIIMATERAVPAHKYPYCTVEYSLCTWPAPGYQLHEPQLVGLAAAHCSRPGRLLRLLLATQCEAGWINFHQFHKTKSSSTGSRSFSRQHKAAQWQLWVMNKEPPLAATRFQAIKQAACIRLHV